MGGWLEGLEQVRYADRALKHESTLSICATLVREALSVEVLYIYFVLSDLQLYFYDGNTRLIGSTIHLMNMRRKECLVQTPLTTSNGPGTPPPSQASGHPDAQVCPRVRLLPGLLHGEARPRHGGDHDGPRAARDLCDAGAAGGGGSQVYLEVAGPGTETS